MLRCSVAVPPQSQGFLGIVNSIPDEVTAIKNFVVIFGIQLAFSLDELLANGSFPTAFELCQTTLSSLVITLAMYGYNKYKANKEGVT